MVSYPKRSTSTVTPVTIANTVTETVVSRLTLPANSVVSGSMFEGYCAGILSTPATGSPQITATARIGGLAGTAIASIAIPATTSQTNVSFWVGWHAACNTIGTSGTWSGSVHDIDVLSGPNANVVVSSSPVTRDTTIANDLVLTLQWSAAVSGNTLTAIISDIFQVT